MRSVTALLLACAGVLCLASCSSEHFTGEVHGVVRVFWHERCDYSVHVRDPGSDEIRVVRLPAVRARLVADVPEGELMWVAYEATRVKELGSVHVRYDLIEIHVHDQKDIDGGPWDHGKFGSGRTDVVE